MTTHHTDEKKPAQGGRLQAQHLATASAGYAEADLDAQIAKVVFGLDSAAVQAWPWGVPPFSTERNWAAAVVGRMLAHEAASEFDAELERRALLWGWKNDGGFKSEVQHLSTCKVRRCQAPPRTITNSSLKTASRLPA